MPLQSDGETSTPEPSSAGLSRRDLLKGALAGAGALAVSGAGPVFAQEKPAADATPAPGRASTQVVGRSTQPPYILPTTNGVIFKAILTVGDPAANGYRMVGIPDGLAAWTTGSPTFTLLMNHELGATAGIVRKHGSRGAFVSRWKIDRSTLTVVEGKDFNQSPSAVYLWSEASRSYSTGSTAWARFCSGDMPLQGALQHMGVGTVDRIYFNGEEIDNGRAWAHIATGPEAGTSWQLPRMGRLSWENLVFAPGYKLKTVGMCLDDGALSTAPVASANPCELMVYIGTKVQSGNTIEKAGLTNGKLYGFKIWREQTLVTQESNDFGFGDSTTGYVDIASFSLVELGPGGDVSQFTTGLQLSQDAISKDVFRFQRIEDGAWDPRPEYPNDFYFVTTASPTLNSRLWHVHFNDRNLPENGGYIEILVNGGEMKMADNMCIDRRGRIILTEDIGNNTLLSGVWVYGIDSGELVRIGQSDPSLFTPGQPGFVTQDEEVSGVIDVADILGDGWFLLDHQIHRAHPDPELVEGGQLLAMYVPLDLARTGVLRARRTN